MRILSKMAPFAALALTAAIAPNATAQTIVNTGDNLASMINSASDGTVFEIHSDATFEGSFEVFSKVITVRAGAGFSPTIKGTNSGYVAQMFSTNPPPELHLEGLRLEASGSLLFRMDGTGSAPIGMILTVDDCILDGDVRISGTGDTVQDCTFIDTEITGSADFVATGSATIPVSLTNCTIANELDVATISNGHVDLTIDRCVIDEGARVRALSTGTLTAKFISTLIAGDMSISYGIETSGNVVADFTNVTVTGFTTGIKGLPAVAWHNMLIYGNTTDLENVLAGEIMTSVISDGTHAGIDGNASNPPLLGTNFGLLSASPGVDSGNDLAPNLGTLDVFGNARIQDNNGNTFAVVNAGAVENTDSQPGSATVVNGNGINPFDYTAVGAPVAGSSYNAFIAVNVNTVITVVGYDTPAAAPFTISGYTGEFLINLSPSLFYDVNLAAHSVPIPPLAAYIGFAISTQGFRFDNAGPAVDVICLNGIDLIIGG